MEFRQIVSFLNESPTGLALVDCAARTKTRFGIRGGVARNLHLDGREQYRDLFDAVDPFSDIDIVVDDSREGMRLLEVIFASVPFAGFYRWEVMAYDAVVAWLEQNPHFALDEFIVWIDWKTTPTVSESRLVESDAIALSDPLTDDKLADRFGKVSLGELILSYVKLLTIFARGEDETNNRDIIAVFNGS